MLYDSHKKLYHVVFCLLLFSALVSGAEAWYYDDSSANDGSSEARAYIIRDEENFRLFRDRVNSGTESAGKYYRLARDLDLSSDVRWEPIGYDAGFDAGNNPASHTHTFKGHFNGDRHTILVSIDRSGSESSSAVSGGNVYAGLFGIIGAGIYDNDSIRASVQNLNVTGKVRALVRPNRENYVDAGGIAAAVLPTGSISNCTFSGDVSAVNEQNGDLFNFLYITTNAGGITAYSNGPVTGCEVKTGSLVSARDSFSTAESYTKSVAGGIVAVAINESRTEITGNTSRARILNADRRGGIIGSAGSSIIIRNNKYSSALWGLGSINPENYDIFPSDNGCRYDPISLTILTRTLPAITVGQRYEVTLEASEVKNVVWERTKGSMPPGLTLAETGIISGVPTSGSNYSFDVRAYVSTRPSIRDTVSYSLTEGSQGNNTHNPDNGNNNPAPDNNSSSGSGGGSGGCNSGTGLLGLALSVAVLWKKR